MTFRRTTCAHCRKKLVPERHSQIVHVECAPEWGEAQAAKREREEAKKARMAARVERAQDRKKREEQKTLHDLMGEADKAFCWYIRERDRKAGLPCISSGRPLDWSGNMVDGGHYRSKGAASWLRYNEDNCHAQSKADNLWKSGNAVDYRIRLIDRIGLDRVAALECDNQPTHRWTREVLIEKRDYYRAMARQLEKERA